MIDLVELIPGLLQKTKEGKVQWEDISGGSFITRLGENSAEVGYNRAGVAKLSLLDSSGRTLETLDWSDISGPYDVQLVELVEIARRKALRIEETLNAVKGFLDHL